MKSQNPLFACWLAIIIAMLGLSSTATATPPLYSPLAVFDNFSVVKGRILSSHDVINDSTELTLGLELNITPGWYLYGPSIAKDGLPTTVSWHNKQLSFAPNRWPITPKDGHFQDTIITTTVAHLENSTDTTSAITIETRYSFLACNGHSCLPQKGSLKRTIYFAENSTANSDEIEILSQMAAGEYFNADNKGMDKVVINDYAALTNGANHHNDGNNFIWILFMALCGGLLLNFMPCVLPVLGIKIFSLIKNCNASRPKRFLCGLCYALGVIFSMWILALIVILLKRAGNRIGWGFQFQEPLYLLAMIFISIIAAANMFGFFEIKRFPSPHLKPSNGFYYDQLLSGLFTVCLATPCSAPLLGPAIGLAFLGNTIQIMVIFSTIGLGIALPYLLLSVIPSWQNFLPKPGKWMYYGKKLIGLIFVGIAIWLTTIIINSDYNKEERDGHWEIYSPEVLSAHLASGHPVFVDFTASWCLICQQNERLIFSDNDFLIFAKQNNLALLKADWTQKDEAILTEIQKNGRSGVPLYLLYLPQNGPTPLILPEILTLKTIKQALSAKN